MKIILIDFLYSKDSVLEKNYQNIYLKADVQLVASYSE